MLKQNLIFCSAIFRRDLFNQTAGYNLNMKYGWEDWDLWLSFIELGANICRINETMFYYRKHEPSMVNEISINSSKRQYLEQQLIKNHINLYVEHFKEPLTLLRELDFLKSDQESFERWKYEIIHSLDYKIGNYFLRPIRFINKLFLNRKK